ncbi:MAG: hypothetical protein ACRC42_01305 [Mycoplasma sp.]
MYKFFRVFYKTGMIICTSIGAILMAAVGGLIAFVKFTNLIPSLIEGNEDPQTVDFLKQANDLLESIGVPVMAVMFTILGLIIVCGIFSLFFRKSHKAKKEAEIIARANR